MAIINYGGAEGGVAPLGAIAVSSVTAASGGGVPRTGTYAYRAASAGAVSNIAFGAIDATGVPVNMGRTATTYYTAYIKFASLPSVTASVMWVLQGSSSPWVEVQVTSGGAVTLVGSATSGTIATLSTGTWYRLDLRVESGVVAGLSIDGGAETTVAVVGNTQDRFRLGVQTGVTCDIYYDDFVISDSGFVSSPAVRLAIPIGAGTVSGGWTNGTSNLFSAVDEVPPNTTDYVSDTGAGTNIYRTFTMQSAATVGLTNSIINVRAAAQMREETSTTTLGAVILRSGGVDSRSSDVDIGTTAYDWFVKDHDTDPATGAAWTTSGYNAIEVGPYKGADASGIRCTAVYAMVLTGIVAISVTPSTAALTLTSFAPTVTVSNNQTVTPSIASLTTTKYAPTVTATAHQSVTPSPATLSLAAFAPAVSTTAHVTVTPTTAARTTTAYAPTVTATAHQAATPSTLALTTSRFAPTVTASNHITVTPTTASLATTKYAPTVTASDHKTVTPSTLALTTAKFAPTVSVTADQVAQPGKASLVLTAFAPTVSTTAHVSVTPSTAALVTTKYAPTVTASNHITVTPSTSALVLTPFAPTLAVPGTFTPATAALSLTTFAPAVLTPVVVTPATVSLTTARFAPTVATPVVVTPGTQSLTTTSFAPVVLTPVTVTPGAASLSTMAYAPFVAVSSNVTASPPPAGMTTTTYAPDVVIPLYLEPGAAELALTGLAPTVTASDHQTVTPEATALVLTSLAPEIGLTALAVPAPAGLVLTTYSPKVTAKFPVYLDLPAVWSLTVGLNAEWWHELVFDAQHGPVGVEAVWWPAVNLPARSAPVTIESEWS